MTNSARNHKSSHHQPRRSFTLIELIIAGVLTAFVLGGITTSISSLSKAKATSRQRLEAHLRADGALSAIRREVVSIIRNDDLFWTRFVLIDNVIDTPRGTMDRDELLIFNNRLKPVRSLEYNGEGTEYETQFRIQDDDIGPTLWRRRDPLPDKYPMGGGIAIPVTESLVGLKIEGYDGFEWHDEWDSDYEGLPLAVRITVTASGDYGLTDVYDAPLVTLRTIVSIDRILLPRQNLVALMQIAEEEAGVGDGPSVDAPDGSPGLDDLDISGLMRDAGIDPSQFGTLDLTPYSDDGLEVISGPIGTIGNNGIRVRDPRGEGRDITRPRIVRPGTSTGSTRGNNRGGSN